MLMRMRTSIRCQAIVFVLAGVCLGAQQQPAQQQPTQQQPDQQQPEQPLTPTFKTGTRLVVHTVSVRDGQGRAVEGLTAKDFVIEEDGEAQQISFVEFQQLPDRASEAPPSAPAAVRDAPGETPAQATQRQIVKPPERYRDRRLMVLYFDLSAMPPTDQARAYGAALKFVDTEMRPSELLAIMTFGGGAVRVKQDFTSDRGLLRGVIQALMSGEDRDGDGLPDNVDVGSAFGQDDAEFAILNTDRQLSALQTAVSMLRNLPEQKSLIYFTSGLRLNGVDNQAQLRATTNAAIRANVTMHPIDARGLVAQPLLGDATKPSQGGVGIFNDSIAQKSMTGFQRSQDALFSLAKDTGGEAMFDYNDLSKGIVDAAEGVTSYYIIGYYTTHPASDGRFRRVRVALAGGVNGELAYRRGYFADKTFAEFSTADKERQLEEALMLENPITEVTVAMELNYFQLNNAEYFVPVSVKIPGRELTLAQKRGAKRTVLDFIGEVKDEFGATMQNVRDKLDLRLDDATAEQLSTRPVLYETGFTLLPGKYAIKMLVRDAETGRIGTFQTSFEVPNLNRENQRVPMSSVVLSSQRVPLSAAIAKVKQKADPTANPLVLDGDKLVPSVTRVFSRRRELYVMAQVYQRNRKTETEAGTKAESEAGTKAGTEAGAEARAETAAPAAPQVMAFVTFYRGGTKALETAPLALTPDSVQAANLPLRFSVPLENLAPGRYDCQVSVLDGGARRATFWRAPVVIVP
jgi:VWFA-related protein